MSRRDQAHQRVFQTRSTRSTTATYKDACRLLQKHTRALKSDWWERKAVELQRAADRNDMKGFYSGLKEVWGPKKNGPVQLKSTDGMETFSDSKRVVARWSEHFQKRSIMRITWMDKVTNKEILERTELPSMVDLLIRKNLRWTGHLMRMSPDRLPKQVLYTQLSSGHRKTGRPRLRFKDTIKRNLKLRDIKIVSWTSLSQQRDKWRATVK